METVYYIEAHGQIPLRIGTDQGYVCKLLQRQEGDSRILGEALLHMEERKAKSKESWMMTKIKNLLGIPFRLELLDYKQRNHTISVMQLRTTILPPVNMIRQCSKPFSDC